MNDKWNTRLIPDYTHEQIVHTFTYMITYTHMNACIYLHIHKNACTKLEEWSHLLIIYVALKCQDNLAGNDAYSQTWWPQFNPQAPHNGRNQSTH